MQSHKNENMHIADQGAIVLTFARHGRGDKASQLNRVDA